MKRVAGISWVAIASWVGLLGIVAPLRAEDDVAGRIKRTLQARLPKLSIDAVQPAPVPGIYEVFVGNEVAYADATGNYLFVGRLMDTRNRRDLSAEQLDAHMAIDFHKLPFDRAIKIVKGNGKRQLALFADPDCPYCRQLEQSMRSISDVTIYVFLYPLESVHPGATVHAHEIWCSADRASAWTQWLLERKPPPGAGKAPPGASCAGDPVNELQALGTSLHIYSTPTMFLENGHRVGGAMAAPDLEKLLAQGSKEVPRTAAVSGAGHGSGG